MLVLILLKTIKKTMPIEAGGESDRKGKAEDG